VTLDLDGQRLAYFNSAARPEPMTWPGADGSGVITLTFELADGSPAIMETERGPWAWLRMLRGALRPGPLPEVFELRLATQGLYADFELRANSVDNPFDLKMFSSFTCPDRF
jgi:type VI secretion system protein ImpL